MKLELATQRKSWCRDLPLLNYFMTLVMCICTLTDKQINEQNHLRSTTLKRLPDYSHLPATADQPVCGRHKYTIMPDHSQNELRMCAIAIWAYLVQTNASVLLRSSVDLNAYANAIEEMQREAQRLLFRLTLSLVACLDMAVPPIDPPPKEPSLTMSTPPSPRI